MRATLNDIAKKVGVSQSTVSRVINGTAPISDEMKNKVYKATALHETLRKENLLRLD